MPWLGRACGFIPASGRELEQTPLSINFCHLQGLGPGRRAATKVPQGGGSRCLHPRDLSTLKRPCGQPGPRVPSPAPCGRTEQYWAECPASETLIYYRSPQVQRAVPGPTSWADISPLLRIQASGREPAPPVAVPTKLLPLLCPCRVHFPSAAICVSIVGNLYGVKMCIFLYVALFFTKAKGPAGRSSPAPTVAHIKGQQASLPRSLTRGQVQLGRGGLLERPSSFLGSSVPPQGPCSVPKAGKKAGPRPAGAGFWGGAGGGKNRVLGWNRPSLGAGSRSGEGEPVAVCARARVWWCGWPQWPWTTAGGMAEATPLVLAPPDKVK